LPITPPAHQEAIITEDIQRLIDVLKHDVSTFDGKRILITGGTGFIGTWLLHTLRAAYETGVKFQAQILTRSKESFLLRNPELARFPAFDILEGNISSFELPSNDELDLVFHAATDASASLNANAPLQMFDTIVQGTRHVLEIAVKAKAKRLLFLSSGAIYGEQPSEILKVPETRLTGPDCTNPINTYGEAKRAAELIVSIYNRDTELEIVTARIYSVLGPLLALGTHFAAGNFLSDALAGKTVTVKGDGRAVRSYIYPTDLIHALLAIWLRGIPGQAYNVGSPEGVSIKDLAALISRLVGTGDYNILGQTDAGWNPGRYVPDTTKLEQGLGCRPFITLEEAIVRTANYYRGHVETGTPD